MTVAILRRLRAMDGAELRFRAAAAVRSRIDRARTAWASPTWRRESLRLSANPSLSLVRDALSSHDWLAAHKALATHFCSRPAVFPLDPSRLPHVASEIRTRFSIEDAVQRAERLVTGEYDLLGYRGVRIASPPDWHLDPVHHRRAPMIFWESVPYLDPACGDHKITWELNRHQHFLTLGRAYALTGDDRYYREFVTQITSWIAANPPLLGTNWASMLELAFRSLSWIWALHFFAGAVTDGDREPWIVDLLLALDRQLTHVEQNLSRYFSPNTHLSGEALALYVAGRSLPELESSANRADVGRDVLIKEAQRQVRDDGMHAELSAHYHRYSTDFYLLALNIAQITHDRAEPAFRHAALRQARALRLLADDNGRLPLIGDDDGGQLLPICGRAPADCTDTLATAGVLLNEPALALAEPPEEAWWLCPGSALERFRSDTTVVPSAALEASGYCVSRNTLGDHLVFDCGPHGFLNGGHAHADALAIVLTVRGRPFLVDPGTASYTMDPERRDRFRSSPMHNTVVVNGRTQSETAGPFHWRSRTDAICTAWRTSPVRDSMSGRLHQASAPVTHSREVMAVHGTGWGILDRLIGGNQVDAAAMWHVHPDWRLDHLEHNTAQFTHSDGSIVTLTTSVTLERAPEHSLDEYSPEYGRILRATCLRSHAAGPTPLSLSAFVLASSVHPEVSDMDEDL